MPYRPVRNDSALQSGVSQAEFLAWQSALGAEQSAQDAAVAGRASQADHDALVTDVRDRANQSLLTAFAEVQAWGATTADVSRIKAAMPAAGNVDGSWDEGTRTLTLTTNAGSVPVVMDVPTAITPTASGPGIEEYPAQGVDLALSANTPGSVRVVPTVPGVTLTIDADTNSVRIHNGGNFPLSIAGITDQLGAGYEKTYARKADGTLIEL